MAMKIHWIGIALGLSVTLAACTKTTVRTVEPIKEPGLLLPVEPQFKRIPEDQYRHRQWIERAARRLGAGTGVGSLKELNRLSLLSREDILGELMKRPEFGDSVLDFGMYFLGAKLNDVRDETGSLPFFSAEFYPQAISLAKSVLANQDFFSFFDLEPKLFVTTLSPAFIIDPNDETLTQPQLRDRHFKKAQEMLVALINELREKKPDRAETCKLFSTKADDVITYMISSASLSAFNLLLFQEDGLGQIQTYCTDASSPPIDVVERLDRFIAQYKNFVEQAKIQFPPDSYSPRHVVDVKEFNYSDFGITQKSHAFSFGLNSLTNSSTNFNRKRGAYILQRFFCDDLTPINVAQPQDHATPGSHVNDPACIACHYKLDPMAGFFMQFGARFEDHSRRKNLTFDDGAKSDLQTYQSSWLAAPGSKHAWQIGIVRSPQHDRFNTWITPESEGKQTLGRLFDVFKTAPEVRKCIIRRMFEYYSAENQAVDPGYLEELTDQFNAQSKTNSALAFKSVISRLLTNRTFDELNPDPNECYDTRTGSTPTQIPCQVAHLLDTQCSSCHDSQSAAGGLDLSQMIKTNEGKLTFIHKDSSGKQISPKETFGSILNRLSTTDPQLRMPKGTDFSVTDRATLYRWTSEMLEAGAR
jgi:hypothetical protein